MAFPTVLPKFNLYSLYVKQNYGNGLLAQQRDALQKLEEWFQTDNPRIAVVSMPTGSGKTGILCCLPFTVGGIGLEPSRDANNYPTGVPRYRFDRPVLVLAPGIQIANQLQQQIHLNPFLVRRGIIGDQYRKEVLPKVHRVNETRDLQNARFLSEQDIVLANAQKFRGEWEDALPNNMFQLVIVDEAHHYPAETWSRIIQKFRWNALVVFLTATPYRMDGRFMVEGPFAYHLPLQEAVEGRIIRRTEPDFLQIKPNHDENGDFEAGIYQLVLGRVNEKQEIKNRDHRLPDNIPHMAMAITKNIFEADRVVDLWNENWGKDSALSYHSKLPQAVRDERMQRIRRNQVKLVVVVAMLQEGFDHPPISIAAILTSIVSVPKFVQFIGRAQRIYRSQAVAEADAICADIVSHVYYGQEGHYENFIGEKLIEIDDQQ
ncbi:putative DNA repair helicase RadD [Montipora capricornis]|uniref:putative DNA repair helicase RadD n=1 Tax=Montipora capricornis TaxID=246305 RepID=UPI0035F1F96A